MDGRCARGKNGVTETAACPQSLDRTMKRSEAIAIDRARAARRTDGPEVEAIWRALSAGRLTLLDRFESNGRRFLIVRENVPGGRVARALSPREGQVVALAALGHSNKLVAHCLGISRSMVAACLRRAMDKLGLRCRVELVQICARLGGPSGVERT